MDFTLSEEQLMIRDMCRQFANEVIAPRVEEMEKSGGYPYDIMGMMGELGMMRITFAEEYGGGGGAGPSYVFESDLAQGQKLTLRL